MVENKAVYKLGFNDECEMSLDQFISQATKFETKGEGFDDIEDAFWENVEQRSNGKTENPFYAIDNEKSLFSNECTIWNQNTMTSDDSIIHKGDKLCGVNTPLWNKGMRFTAFGIHLEDSNLGSINELHHGQRKFWYSVPGEYGKRLAECVQSVTKNDSCNLAIRHKDVIISPLELKKWNIPFAKVIF